MMKAKGMSTEFWGEAVSTALFILNRAPTNLKGMTLFEAWFERKLDVSFLMMFGCIGHVKKMKANLTKLEDRSTPMVLLGYEEGSNAYRMFDPRGGKVVVSRDVVFDEMAAWDWKDLGTGEASGVGGMYVIEHLVIRGGRDAGAEEPGELPSPAMAGSGK
jgi:hypothetical protein